MDGACGNVGGVTTCDVDKLRNRVYTMPKNGGRVTYVCVMGSMPQRCPLDTYANLTSGLAGKDSLVLLIHSVVRLDLLLGTLSAIGKGDKG